MGPLQTLRVALRALLRNKMRSVLTALGIIIGVAAVIAMVALGQGAKERVQAQFAAMGSNLLIVLPGSSLSGGSRGGFGTQPTLTYDDLEAIRSQCPSVLYAAPEQRATATVASEDQNWTTSVRGTQPDWFAIRTWTASSGRLLEDGDGGAKVVLLGRTVADQLYGAGADPLGQTVRIRNIPFLVVGVLAAKGQSPMGQDYDDTVVIPLRTFREKIQGGLAKYLGGPIYVGSDSREGTGRAEEEVRNLLRERHRLRDGDADDFNIRNLTEVATAMEEGAQTMSLLLASIAAVSLLVGGIGIMNIMLVSVTERTREIGLRMAVGARPSHILLQFLGEASLLAMAGGLIGLALGTALALWAAARFAWTVSLDPLVALIAIGFSALVGIVFGLYPARKASRLDPIEALRYE